MLLLLAAAPSGKSRKRLCWELFARDGNATAAASPSPQPRCCTGICGCCCRCRAPAPISIHKVASPIGLLCLGFATNGFDALLLLFKHVPDLIPHPTRRRGVGRVKGAPRSAGACDHLGRRAGSFAHVSDGGVGALVAATTAAALPR